MAKSSSAFQKNIEVKNLEETSRLLKATIAEDVIRHNELVKEGLVQLEKNEEDKKTLSGIAVELSDRSNLLDKEEQRLAGIAESLQLKADKIDQEKITVEQLKKVHQQAEDAAKANLSQTLLQIEVAEKELTTVKENSEKLLDKLNKDILDKKTELSTLLDEVDSNEMYIKELLSKLTCLEKDLESLNKETLELQRINILEGIKAKKGVESLIQREDELEKKQRNYQVLHSRLKRKLAFLYPEQDIDKLI